MSNGRKNISGETQLITLSPEEFAAAVKRVQKFLLNRAERAQARKQAQPTKRAAAGQVRAAEDLFVFTHMMELVEYLSGEIGNLRQVLTMMGGRSEESRMPDLFVPKKTNLPN